VPAGDSADAEDGNDTGVDRVGTCTETGAEVVVVVVIEVEIIDENDDGNPRTGQGGSRLTSFCCCCPCLGFLFSPRTITQPKRERVFGSVSG